MRTLHARYGAEPADTAVDVIAPLQGSHLNGGTCKDLQLFGNSALLDPSQQVLHSHPMWR
jgi:hypothetical protein